MTGVFKTMIEKGSSAQKQAAGIIVNEVLMLEVQFKRPHSETTEKAQKKKSSVFQRLVNAHVCSMQRCLCIRVFVLLHSTLGHKSYKGEHA